MNYKFIKPDANLGIRGCVQKFIEEKVYSDKKYKLYIRAFPKMFKETNEELIKEKKNIVILANDVVEITETNVAEDHGDDFETNADIERKLTMDKAVTGFKETDDKKQYLNGIHWTRIRQIAEHYEIKYTTKDATIKKLLRVNTDEDNK